MALWTSDPFSSQKLNKAGSGQYLDGRSLGNQEAWCMVCERVVNRANSEGW